MEAASARPLRRTAPRLRAQAGHDPSLRRGDVVRRTMRDGSASIDSTGLNNNARFLILPWVNAPNLASCILARAARQLPRDWLGRYGHAPALLETFVERNRFRGTCYRAANWIHVGATRGRGKLDIHMRLPVPVKDIFLYPLRKHFRRELCAAAPQRAGWVHRILTRQGPRANP